MAYSSIAVLLVDSGYRVVLKGNQATLDGGGLAFDGGASLSLALEGCNSNLCPAVSIGDGTCDAACLERACNWWAPCPLLIHFVTPV